MLPMVPPTVPDPQRLSANGGDSCLVAGVVTLSLNIIGPPNVIVKLLHDFDFLKNWS